MSAGERVPLVEAIARADALREALAGTFDQWHVVGSVRRCKDTVGDIDHVVVPRIGDFPPSPGEIFGGHGNMLLHALDAMLERGEIGKAVYGESRTTRWGEKKRGLVFDGFKHEIWIVPPEALGPAMAIGTGPDEYSRMLVTQLKSRGIYQQGAPGLDGFVVEQATLKIRPCRTEQEYFELCGVVYTPPAHRRVAP